MPKLLPPVDDDVFEELQLRAEPLVDDVNSVLRRLLGITDPQAAGNGDSGPKEASRPTPAPRKSQRTGAVRNSTKSKSKKRTRAPKGSLLPESEYELPILRTLNRAGGSAPASRVIDAVGEELGGAFMPADLEQIDSGLVRWKNRTQFVRLTLIKAGDLKSGSPRGVWEISDQGQARVEKADAGTS